MKNAFKLVFEKRYKKVTIIGTDCPDLNAGILLKSFRELSKKNIMIGPSTDGGYYLLGMNGFYPFLFNGIEWSSTQVLTDTINKVKANNLSMFMLPELIDIDTEQDLKDWLSKAKKENNMTELINEYKIR